VRHEHVGFVGGIAEHQTLIAGTLFLATLPVHALVDVGRLLAQGIEHRAGVAVEADVRMGVADLDHRVADQLFVVDRGGGGDLAGQDDHAGLGQGLAGDPGMGILTDDFVEHGIGNLIADLVGMAFGDRFGREQEVAHVGFHSSQ